MARDNVRNSAPVSLSPRHTIMNTLTVSLLLVACLAYGGRAEVEVEDGPEYYDTWRYDINFADMNAGNTLPDGDLIIATENDGSGATDGNGEACTDALVPDGKIALRLSLNEFVTKWKALALHRKGVPNTYRLINEIEGNQGFMTIIIDKFDLDFNYDLCLWKESSGLFPSRNNIYRIVDAPTRLQAGRIYNILWTRDLESMDVEP